MQSKRIIVVGSLNADLSVRVERLPHEGETIAGYDLVTGPGGKGANQAIAAGRLNGDVAMLGRVGADGQGALLRGALADAGVNVTGVCSTSVVSTGTALILVDAAGRNQITVVSGANATFTPGELESAKADLSRCALVMAQLEIPLETVTEAFRVARQAGVPTMLDPAPARPLPHELLQLVTWLTPNQREAEVLTGRQIRSVPEAAEAGRYLASLGPSYVVVKLGAEGALLCTGESIAHVPAFPVRAVDTTAAGDAFNGALAVALTEGRTPLDAVIMACAAGALAATKAGAATALPDRAGVESLLSD